MSTKGKVITKEVTLTDGYPMKNYIFAHKKDGKIIITIKRLILVPRSEGRKWNLGIVKYYKDKCLISIIFETRQGTLLESLSLIYGVKFNFGIK